jgi:hypothetical protein
VAKKNKPTPAKSYEGIFITSPTAGAIVPAGPVQVQGSSQGPDTDVRAVFVQHLYCDLCSHSHQYRTAGHEKYAGIVLEVKDKKWTGNWTASFDYLSPGAYHLRAIGSHTAVTLQLRVAPAKQVGINPRFVQTAVPQEYQTYSASGFDVNGTLGGVDTMITSIYVEALDQNGVPTGNRTYGVPDNSGVGQGNWSGTFGAVTTNQYGFQFVAVGRVNTSVVIPIYIQ